MSFVSLLLLSCASYALEVTLTRARSALRMEGSVSGRYRHFQQVIWDLVCLTRLMWSRYALPKMLKYTSQMWRMKKWCHSSVSCLDTLRTDCLKSRCYDGIFRDAGCLNKLYNDCKFGKYEVDYTNSLPNWWQNIRNLKLREFLAYGI